MISSSLYRWQATLATTCPNGTSSIPTAAGGAWWPTGINPTPVNAVQGKATITRSDSPTTGAATIHLTRR